MCFVYRQVTGAGARVRGHVFVVIVMIIIDKLDSDDVRLSSIITINKIGQDRWEAELTQQALF